ncbi:atherin-like [Antechinus flavipes]|uniref:atherin-like n=1 Tax=Antechinus flavipes TaxID=38775 RepID=UPI002235DD77|nr:atherin-like [Antechinus flavipes]
MAGPHGERPRFLGLIVRPEFARAAGTGSPLCRGSASEAALEAGDARRPAPSLRFCLGLRPFQVRRTDSGRELIVRKREGGRSGAQGGIASANARRWEPAELQKQPRASAGTPEGGNVKEKSPGNRRELAKGSRLAFYVQDNEEPREVLSGDPSQRVRASFSPAQPLASLPPPSGLLPGGQESSPCQAGPSAAAPRPPPPLPPPPQSGGRLAAPAAAGYGTRRVPEASVGGRPAEAAGGLGLPDLRGMAAGRAGSGGWGRGRRGGGPPFGLPGTCRLRLCQGGACS